MKTKFFIITLLFLMGITMLKAQNKDNDTQKAIVTLKEFYKVIYDEVLDDKEPLFKKYLSKELYHKVFPPSPPGEDNSPGYDPFIQGQDYEAKTLNNSLKITHIEGNIYKVCFVLFSEDKKKTCVDLQLKKNGQGKYMITNILSDKNFYIKPKRN
ncbi:MULTISPECIES: DUF3828 domain-containing protein [unclassified Capnocytophaga]|uniref:DUF3828 domain-containing protein n=1 Tax=unclassified Capnocytophaga TaxID=2640652 RepID=UPI000202D194|nr:MULTISPECIES: DUF3828 domain-containing protein [unclassified Capnocytophaga]EGD33287.1 hypothetical protein HMPREF9071_2081 [Capnocytophaga sp. oral taxon 338 str. F0234]MEB3004120.1 DUF3828 domain-containing protein [Capnocytophaga sp. G2]